MAQLRFSAEKIIALWLTAAVFVAACASHTVSSAPPPGAGPVENPAGTEAEFVGVPIIGDYDVDGDLDFVLRADSGEYVYKIRVHEDMRMGNSSLVSDLRSWINEIVDLEPVRVAGSYTPEYRGDNFEYGALALREISFLDSLSTFEPPYRTDPSRLSHYLMAIGVGVVFFFSGGR
ncbi:MAG: hypothetical protein FVQ81_11215 [Candidatus Glassbacteria bacterium]|nr:hypothetical protein [Candidatus Glassbacteria bacterium]